jgi:hypothetical protein
MEHAESFVRFMSASISPIVLISGVGLILLSLTNRLGRTIDRARAIVAEISSGAVKDEKKKRIQLRIIYRRSRILRSSIVAIAFSILTSSLIVPVILVMEFFNVNLKVLGIFFFMLSVTGVIVSAIFFLVDVVLTLNALNYEVRDHL